jgi:hypothetical protein
VQYFNVNPSAPNSNASVQSYILSNEIVTPKKPKTEFKFDGFESLDNNLKEFFILKKKQEQLEELIKRRMDTIRSPNDPRFHI